MNHNGYVIQDKQLWHNVAYLELNQNIPTSLKER